MAADIFLEKSMCECTSPCEFRHAMACFVERTYNQTMCGCKVGNIAEKKIALVNYLVQISWVTGALISSDHHDHNHIS
jgi:hypothetical protein